MNYPQIKPTLNLDFSNTKTLDPRINFRRGTPGAYYDGKTYAKAEENLISYSEDFTNSSWEKREFLTPEGSQDDPEGGTSAFNFVPTTNNSLHLLFSNITAELGNSYTHSIFAKDNGYSILRIALSTGFGRSANSDFVDFDLSSGLIVNNPNALSASISSAGGSWYRCTVSAICDGYPSGSARGEDRFVISVNDVSSNDGSYTFAGDGSSGLYLWGAQLEQRDSVTAYTPTDGNPITKYQPQLMFASPDQPRFDHDPLTGESKGLLIEESRTNLIRWSEDFAIEPEMNYYDCTIDDNRIVAPDGNLSADAIIFDDGSTSGLSAGHREVVSSGEKYTASIYAKAGNLSKVWFYFNVRQTNEALNVGNSGIKYNLLTNTVDEIVDTNDQFSTEYNIFDVGNGWYRLVISATMPSNAGFLGWALYNYEDNVSSGKNTAYIWGAQLEQGSFPTSYIKTSGASATRSADNASITGENFSSWYRQDEGSIYADILPNYAIHYGTAALTIGTTQDSLSFSPGVAGQVRFFIRTNDISQATIDQTGFTENNLKLSAAYASDYAYFSANGETVGEDTSVLLPRVDSMKIGQDRFGSEMCAHIKKLSYYPQRLTNEQLQQLTK